MDLILIKLGGSLITNKAIEYKTRPRIISRLIGEINKAQTENPELNLIVGNGSGSFGHTSAAKYHTAEGYHDDKGKYGFCFVQNDAIKINRVVVQEFLDQKVNAVGVSPNNIIIARNHNTQNIFLNSLTHLIDEKIIPVLYGDTIIDTQNNSCIYSCDKVMAEITKNLPKKYRVVKVISVGDYDGVLDANQKLVKYIDQQIYQQLLDTNAVKGSQTTDVTGGMKAKLDEMIKLSQKGIESIILNGKFPGNLYRCLTGKSYKGTLIKI